MRSIVLCKLISRGTFRRIHPKSVKTGMIKNTPLSATKVSAMTMHILLFFGVLGAGSILISLNNLDMETTITAVVGLFTNSGMALGEVGA